MVPFRWLLVFAFLPMSSAFASTTISQVPVRSSPVTVDATVVVSSISVQTFSVSLSNGTSTVSLSVSSSAAVLMSSNSLGTQSPSSSTIVTSRLLLTTHGTVSSSLTTARNLTIISPRATFITGTSTASTSVEATKPSVTDKTKSEFDWTWTVLGIVIGLIVIISVMIVAGIILKRRGSAEFGKNVIHEMTAAQIENALASSNPVEVET
ncbi:uncharacterized protein [Montipora capricornis]|uniref:uncharacterized protein n=1 Tax=Montipora capricornis TaxID=246305 RepID=UPI0035F1EBE4